MEYGDSAQSDEILQNLDRQHEEKWLKMTQSLDFERSSREAWHLLRMLDECCFVTSNAPLVGTPN